MFFLQLSYKYTKLWNENWLGRKILPICYYLQAFPCDALQPAEPMFSLFDGECASGACYLTIQKSRSPSVSESFTFNDMQALPSAHVLCR